MGEAPFIILKTDILHVCVTVPSASPIRAISRLQLAPRCRQWRPEGVVRVRGAWRLSTNHVRKAASSSNVQGRSAAASELIGAAHVGRDWRWWSFSVSYLPSLQSCPAQASPRLCGQEHGALLQHWRRPAVRVQTRPMRPLSARIQVCGGTYHQPADDVACFFRQVTHLAWRMQSLSSMLDR